MKGIDSKQTVDSNIRMEIALKVSKLYQDLKGAEGTPKTVLKGIDFTIPKGSLTGFIGVNGAGKTTTIKALLGFIEPSSGSIEFFGNHGLTDDSRRRLGFMPERPYFYDYLTGSEFLALHWKLRGHKVDESFEKSCDWALKSVDLERARNLRLRQFSKGMLQRIGIAQAIMHKPHLLILDEPMSGLDPDGRLLVKNIIRNLHAEGTTIFFSSHLLQDMEELCDRLLIIDSGEIIYEGNLIDLEVRGHEEYLMTTITSSRNKETETVLPENLQRTIDQRRKENVEIIQIIPKKLNLEQAFVLLRKKRDAQ